MLNKYNNKELGQWYQENLPDGDLLISLLQEAGKDQKALKTVTYFIKHFLESGEKFTLEQEQIYLHSYVKLTHWAPTYRYFRSLDYLTVSPAHFLEIEPLIRKSLKSESKAVRAFSCHAFALLALKIPDYLPEVIDTLQMKAEIEHGAVPARVRMIMPKLQKALQKHLNSTS